MGTIDGRVFDTIGSQLQSSNIYQCRIESEQKTLPKLSTSSGFLKDVILNIGSPQNS
jgi:hypothetical protein